MHFSANFQQITMAKSTLRLDTRRPLNDGTYPVQVKVGYGTNLYLSTGIYLAKEDWDAGLVVDSTTKVGTFEQITTRILRFILVAQLLILPQR